MHVGAMGDVDIVAPFPTGAAALEEEQVAVDRERRPALDICAVDSGAQIDGCLPRAFRSGAVRDPEIDSAEPTGAVGGEIETQAVSGECGRLVRAGGVDWSAEIPQDRSLAILRSSNCGAAARSDVSRKSVPSLTPLDI